MPRFIHSLLVATLALTLVNGCASGGPRSPAATDAQAVAKRFAPAFASMQEKDYARAEEELTRLARATPQDPQVLLNLGIVYSRTERLVEAVDALEAATQLAPKAATAHNELGIAYRKSGEFARAAGAYREAIRLQPDFAYAHYNLGVLLDVYLRQHSAALTHYESYLALAGAEDKKVQSWVKDLRRRTDNGPATAASDNKVERR